MIRSVLTEDAETCMFLDGEKMGPPPGREGIVGYLEEFWKTQTDQRRHVLSNAIVESETPGEAVLAFYLTLYATKDRALRPVATGRYRVHFVSKDGSELDPKHRARPGWPVRLTVTMLRGYRVLDFTDERGLLAGQILADLGADVIHIEPPGGSRARRRGPFVDDREDPEGSLLWWAYARNQRSIVLDLEDDDDRALLSRLLASADFLIESESPGVMEARGLGYPSLRHDHPGLIYVSISPYGQSGPKASRPGNRPDAGGSQRPSLHDRRRGSTAGSGERHRPVPAVRRTSRRRSARSSRVSTGCGRAGDSGSTRRRNRLSTRRRSPTRCPPSWGIGIRRARPAAWSTAASGSGCSTPRRTASSRSHSCSGRRSGRAPPV